MSSSKWWMQFPLLYLNLKHLQATRDSAILVEETDSRIRSTCWSQMTTVFPRQPFIETNSTGTGTLFSTLLQHERFLSIFLSRFYHSLPLTETINFPYLPSISCIVHIDSAQQSKALKLSWVKGEETLCYFTLPRRENNRLLRKSLRIRPALNHFVFTKDEHKRFSISEMA